MTPPEEARPVVGEDAAEGGREYIDRTAVCESCNARLSYHPPGPNACAAAMLRERTMDYQ